LKWRFPMLALIFASFSLQVYRTYILSATGKPDHWLLGGVICAVVVAVVAILSFAVVANFMIEMELPVGRFGTPIAAIVAMIMTCIVVPLLALFLLGSVVILMTGGLLFPLSLKKPRESSLTGIGTWRSDRINGILTGCLVASLAGFSSFLVTFHAVGIALALRICFVSGIIGFLLANQTYARSWTSRLAFLYFHFRRRTPLQMVSFLEDARSKNILHTVSINYEFRHSRLLERLVANCDRSKWPCSVGPHRFHPRARTSAARGRHRDHGRYL
jgi:hypothetical protein